MLSLGLGRCGQALAARGEFLGLWGSIDLEREFDANGAQARYIYLLTLGRCFRLEYVRLIRL